MNELSDKCLAEISQYLEYIKTKEKDLNVLENEKQNYKTMIDNDA